MPQLGVRVLRRSSEGAEIFWMVKGCFLEGADFEGSPRCGQAGVGAH